MFETNIKVEVHCERPPWSMVRTDRFVKSRYRIYIDDDLITERDWIWDNHTFLVENIWIIAERDKEYFLKLEPVMIMKTAAQFQLKNLKINGIEHPIIQDSEVSFSI